MADELDYQITFSYEKGSQQHDRSIQGTATVTGVPSVGGVQTIGTTAGGEALVVNDVSTNPGFCYFRNLDSTNFCTIGTYVSSVYYPTVKLKAGEFCLLRLVTGLVYRAIADTGNVNLEYYILSD